MNTHTAPNNPAFPIVTPGGPDTIHCEGVTIRQWFAAQALIGIVTYHGSQDMQNNVRVAFEYADAMLAKS